MTQLEQRGEPCVPTGGVSTTATPAGTWREVAERGGEPRDEFAPGVSQEALMFWCQTRGQG